MPPKSLCYVLVACFGASLTLLAQQPPIEPLDARLSGYDYGHPGRTIEFEDQGRRLEMSYLDVAPTGRANGRTVVLLHGKNFNGAYWQRTIDTLTQNGFRVVATDQIGFGKSSKPTAYQYSFHALAQNTANLLDELRIDSAIVLGHSMGGMLAVRFALMYPERTTQLVLLNPIGLEDWKRHVPYRDVGWWRERELGKTYDELKAYQRSNYYDGEWRAAYEEPVRLLAGQALHPDYPALATVNALTYDMIFTQPVVYEFGLLQPPTLLLIGTRDRTALGKPLVSDSVRATLGRYDRLGQDALAAIPNATLVEFEGLGHLPHFEDFPRFAEALLRGIKAERRLAPKPTAPEQYAGIHGMQVTGVTVSEGGRVFVTMPRWREGVAYTLAEIDTVTRQPRPYPSQSANDWRVGQPAGEAFVNVQSAVAVGDTLYVADTRNPLIEWLIAQPVLHLYDLRTDRRVRSYTLDAAATVDKTYVNDLRIDRRRGKVYMTDSGRGGLMVLNLATGKTVRRLDGHPSVQAETDGLTIDGEPWPRAIPSDGIALDVANDRLLYHALTGYGFYAIPLTALNGTDAEARAAVTQLARTPAPDGLWYDAERGLTYMADLERQAVVSVSDAGEVRVLAQGDHIGWADTFSMHDGWLYFTNSKLPQAGSDVSGMVFPVWRMETE